MNRTSRPFTVFVFVVISSAVALLASAVAAPPDNPSGWISHVPVLRTGDKESFQFRAKIDLFGIHLIAYVSWAPPDHRSIIFCDGSDGLPLMVSVDGRAWIYDLVGGQILRSADEPAFKMGAEGERVDFEFGVQHADQAGILFVDFASVFRRKSGGLQTSEDGKGRIAIFTSNDSREALRVTLSDPPKPLTALFEIPKMDPPGRVEFDAFQFGAPLPPWHHPLDTEMLKRDVPYYSLEDMKDLPKDKQELMETFKQLMAGGGTFLIRPAIQDPAARKKLAQLPVKLNFDQMELHEKLLGKAWLRALKRQGIDPAKLGSATASSEDARGNVDAASALSKSSHGLSPDIFVVDLDRLFTGHPDMEKMQRDLNDRATAEQGALKEGIERAKRLAGEVGVLDQKLGDPDAPEPLKKELNERRARIAVEVGQINQRIAAVNALVESWKGASHDELIKKIESSLDSFSSGKDSIIILDKSAQGTNKVPVVVYSSDAMDISEEALEAIRAGKAISPQAIGKAARRRQIASVDLYKVFNSLNQTKEVNEKLQEVVDSSNATIKERMNSLKSLVDEVNRLASEVREAGLDDLQKEEKKRILKEKAAFLQWEGKELKGLELARDKKLAEIQEYGMARIPREMQEAVAEMARAAGADLVLDSAGQNKGSIRMAFHLEGLPDWTQSVIARMNAGPAGAKAQDEASANRTVSSDQLRFGTLDFQKILGVLPAGEVFRRKDAEIAAKLKELAAKHEDSSKSKDALIAEARALLESIVADAEGVIGAEKDGPAYNIVLETGGKSDNGAPLTLTHDNVPDLTGAVIKSLSGKGL